MFGYNEVGRKSRTKRVKLNAPSSFLSYLCVHEKVAGPLAFLSFSFRRGPWFSAEKGERERCMSDNARATFTHAYVRGEIY